MLNEVRTPQTDDRVNTPVEIHGYDACPEYASTGRHCAECRHNQACDEADTAYDYDREHRF